eukprot:TRINITY_DN596_c0_g1_i6.p1 TRINITY_DN596_c0_g1~~TRINITY_DN596_c0_g1_i6.p1  ORF type:complete len:526 (-),score=198.22 TRINITY_DN596_c0_g1_i6:10-1587(-)
MRCRRNWKRRWMKLLKQLLLNLLQQFRMLRMHWKQKQKPINLSNSELLPQSSAETGKSLPSAKQRDNFAVVLGNMNIPLKDVLQKANEAVRDPQNKEKKKELQAAIDNIEVPLCEMKAIIEPESRDRAVELEVAKSKLALNEAVQTAKQKTPAATTAALNKAKNQVDNAVKTAKQSLPNEPQSAQRRKNLEEAINKLENVSTQLPKTGPSDAAVSNIRNEVVNALDNVLDKVKSDIKDDALEAAAKTNNRVTAMTRDVDKMNPKEVIAESSALSKDLDNLVSNVSEHSNNIVPTVTLPQIKKDNTDVRKIVQDIKNVPVKAQNPPIPKTGSVASRIAQLMNNFDSLAKPPPKPVVDIPPPSFTPAPKVRPANAQPTFEDVLEKVAQDIASKVQEFNLKEAKTLSSFLGELATAARTGNKQKLMENGRNVSNSVKELCSQLREYSSKIPKKNRHELQIQDSLVRAAQQLENFGTQLRILTSVKAASVEKDKDTDQSLNSIVSGLGTTVTEGLAAIDITQKTILRMK